MLGRLISKPLRMISKITLLKSLKLGALLASSSALIYGVKASGILKKKGPVRSFVRSHLKPAVHHTRTTTHHSSRTRHH